MAGGSLVFATQWIVYHYNVKPVIAVALVQSYIIVVSG